MFSAANSLTTVESEKFGRIQGFLIVRYKLLAGSAGVVWYKALVTAFIFRARCACDVTAWLSDKTESSSQKWRAE